MITFWPEIGETETLYSIASRLHYLHGGSSAYQTSRWLFGFPTAGSLRFSPRNLDHFTVTTSGMLGPITEVLKARTPVGQFAPFISPTAWHQWESWCRSRPSANKPFLALRNFDLPSRAPLRACLKCVAADQRVFGTAIWRLEHQLLGTYVCIRHGCPLMEEISHLKRKGDTSNSWMRPDDCLKQERLQISLNDPQDIDFWSRASQASWVLATHPRASGVQLRHLVTTRLAHAGIVPTGKRLYAESIRSWWNSIERPCFLESNSFAALEDPQWIVHLLLGRRHDHPLRWAVLCGVTMMPDALRDALSDALSLQMTLEGRWVPSIKLREDLLPPKVWAMLGTGMTIADVSIQSGIPAPQVRHALRLNPSRQRSRDRKVAELSRDSRRNTITAFLQAHPAAGRTGLLRAHSAELRWLELNDWAWISQTLGGSQSLKFQQRSFDFDVTDSVR